jgi:hypothetical protein
MRARKSVTPTAAAKQRDTDSSAARILAFLGSMHMLPGNVFTEEVEQACRRAIGAMQKLALSHAEGWDFQLSTPDCAAILTWMSVSCPTVPNWWGDKEEVSHVCGYGNVLEAMASSLLGRAKP